MFFGQNVSSGGGGPTPTAKTCAAQVSSVTNPATCTWSAAPAAGESIYCGVSSYAGGTVTFTLTDNAGTPNTYSSYGSGFTGTGGYFQLTYSALIANSPTTTTVTVTAGSSFFLAITCMTSTGGSASPTDGVIGTGTVTTGTSVTSTALSPSGTADIMFCFGASNGGTTITAGAGFTLSATAAANTASEYKVLSMSGSQTGSYTITPAVSIADIVCGAFK